MFRVTVLRRLIEMVPAECYDRTVQVRVPGGRHGAGFVIPHNGSEWLVTAAHLVDGLIDDEVGVRWRGLATADRIERIPAPSDADIAVFAMPETELKDLTLNPTSDGGVYSQDVYFLGFPYGLGLRAGKFTFPFVKKGIFSASEVTDNEIIVWYLDGFNNPGFSGGPVVFQHQRTKEWHVAAIVTSFPGVPTPVMPDRGDGAHVVANPGIVVAHDVSHAIKAVEAWVA